MLAAGAVDYVDNAWQVDSQHKAPKWEPGADPVDAEDCDPYRVTADHCSCYDHRLHPDLPCKHQLAVKLYGRILIAQLDAAINDTNSGLYAIEASSPGIYYVMDRATDIDICAAYHVTRTGTYRPETSHDAAAFARWLVAHPADFYPGGLLERLLRTAPGAKITLRADVYYGTIRTYTLSATASTGRHGRIWSTPSARSSTRRRGMRCWR